jgi:hypothetical protein
VIHPAGGAIKGQVLVLDVGANRLSASQALLGPEFSVSGQ